MKKAYSVYIASLLICLVIAAAGAIAGNDHEAGHHGESSAAKEHGNALIEEMLLLDTAFREIVSAVAVSDGGRVLKALEPMHGAMEKTHEGVHHGAVHIPKNADRVREFVNMDKLFHKDLESLATAAKKNDGKAMLTLSKKLMDGCVSCHQQFRK